MSIQEPVSFFFSLNVHRNQEMWHQMCCWLSFRVPWIVIFFHSNRPALTWIFSGIGISWKEQISSCLSCVFVHCLWNGAWWSCAPLLALGKWWGQGSLISVPRAFSLFQFIPHPNIPCSLVNALMLFIRLILLLYICVFYLINIKNIVPLWWPRKVG